MSWSLSPAERAELLLRARRAGARALRLPAPGVDPGPGRGTLAEPGAAFVTWKREGRLRGCIGSVEAVRPLAEDVESNAVAALTGDPRFPPATARDWPALTLDVSVLSPFQAVSSVDEIEVGRHGVYVRKGRRAGLLLPQVAPEWGWSREELLEQLCLKAGLPGDSWRDLSSLSLYRFEADVFGEEPAAPAT